LLNKTTRILNVNQRLGESLDILFSGQTGGRYVKIESDTSGHPLSGVYIIGSMDQITMMGDSIQ
jgi:hypothetical protein